MDLGPSIGTPALHPPNQDLSAGTPALHPPDQDLSAGTPALHPPDQDLSAGTPALGHQLFLAPALKTLYNP